MFEPKQITLLALLEQIAVQHNLKVFVVGGLVRDLFLEHSLIDVDLDLVLEQDAQEYARQCQVRLGGSLNDYKDFLTIKLSGFTGYGLINEIDFAVVRLESYEKPGALPKVRPASSIEEDLQRRDFTVNALALPLSGLLAWLRMDVRNVQALYPITVDRFAGLDDLKERKIRILHERSFEDDPTRILRACRYTARLSGTIEPQSKACLHRAVQEGKLDCVSRFRKFSELKKIMLETDAEACLVQVGRLGIWPALGLQTSLAVGAAPELLVGLAKLKLNLAQHDLVRLLMLALYDWSDLQSTQTLASELRLKRTQQIELSSIQTQAKDFRAQSRLQELDNLALLLCLAGTLGEAGLAGVLQAEAKSRGLVH